LYFAHYSTAEILVMLLCEGLRGAAPLLTIFGGLLLSWAALKWPARALPPE
jgi:hypothetical protein